MSHASLTNGGCSLSPWADLTPRWEVSRDHTRSPSVLEMCQSLEAHQSVAVGGLYIKLLHLISSLCVVYVKILPDDLLLRLFKCTWNESTASRRRRKSTFICWLETKDETIVPLFTPFSFQVLDFNNMWDYGRL